MPDEGRAAVGLWIGPAVPTGDGSTTTQIAGSLDVNLTPHWSVRTDVGSSAMDDPFVIRSSIRRTFVTADAAYDWAWPKVHLYGVAGIGYYRSTGTLTGSALQDPRLMQDLIALGLAPDNRNAKDRDNDLGFNVGGGMEYLLSQRFTVGADVRYHGVGQLLHVLPVDGSYVSAMVGLKRYF